MEEQLTVIKLINLLINFQYSTDGADTPIHIFQGNKELEIDSIRDNRIYGNDNHAIIINVKE